MSRTLAEGTPNTEHPAESKHEQSARQFDLGGCGKTPQYCHPEQQRRISPRVFARQCAILRRLLASQNDSTFEFFRSL
jgi:hypothetical protein